MGWLLLEYAGLGDTAKTEPADWMSAVLRGRNLPLEQSIGILAEAVKAQLPRHLSPRIPQHHVLIPAVPAKPNRGVLELSTSKWPQRNFGAGERTSAADAALTRSIS